MYHSVTFGNRNSWDDWHLIPSTRPVINPPPLKSHYVDVPGSDGVIDLTSYLTGHPVFGNRTGSLEFIVENGHEYWDVLYSKIMNYLNGSNLKIILEDDRNYYYEGRCTVNEWRSDKWYSLIVIDYDLYPYKRERFSSLEDWLWDPFDFETGVIRNYKDLVVNGSLTISIPATREFVVPTFIVTTNNSLAVMSVLYEGRTYTLNNGENRFPDLHLYSRNQNEERELRFSGYGTVSIDYRGGSL